MIIILIIINAFVSSQIFFKKLMNPVPFKQFGSVFYRSQFPQLSAPSIVFAQAEWYGSFRAGVQSASGETTLGAPSSRWGVRGSNEISDGLTAVYRYEEALDLRTATLAAGNRLSYVGLSGGFGTLTMGRVWGAEYNTTGAILDASYFYGNSHGSYRVGPALSYAVSAGPVSMQLDAVMAGNGARDRGDHVHGTGIGEGPDNCGSADDGVTATTRCINYPDDDNTVNTKTIDRILFGLSAGFGSGKVAVSYDANSAVPAVKDTNITAAGEFTFGATRVYLGYSQFKEPNDHNATTDGIQNRKTTSTFAGIGGSFGDNGLSYLVQVVQRKQETGGTAAAAKPTPILLSLAYSLGGSSTVILEGVTNNKTFAGAKQKATVGLILKVDF